MLTDLITVCVACALCKQQTPKQDFGVKTANLRKDYIFENFKKLFLLCTNKMNVRSQ